MKKIIQAIDEKLEPVIVCVLLGAMAIIIILQVFFRYALSNSLSWSEELARYLFIAVTYFGISYAAKTREHVRVDAVIFFLPGRAKKIVPIIGDLLFLVFAVIIVYYGVQTGSTILSLKQQSPAMRIPMGLLYFLIPVGYGLTAIRLVQSIVLRIREILHPVLEEGAN